MNERVVCNECGSEGSLGMIGQPCDCQNLSNCIGTFQRFVMNKFRKKPILIEAVQWMNKTIVCPPGPLWFEEAESKGTIQLAGTTLYIKTLEGEMKANVGDWIIRGIKGEIYPCKPDIFEETYEPAE